VVVGGVLGEFRRSVPEHHVEFLAGLPACYEDDAFMFSHAGTNVDIGCGGAEEALVNGARVELRGQFVRGCKIAVCGHYYQHEQVVRVHRGGVCIDTGCGTIGGPLTALLLPEMETIGVCSALGVTRARVETVD
jgi:hypothetical protein